jgi:hypothetical protein
MKTKIKKCTWCDKKVKVKFIECYDAGNTLHYFHKKCSKEHGRFLVDKHI